MQTEQCIDLEQHRQRARRSATLIGATILTASGLAAGHTTLDSGFHVSYAPQQRCADPNPDTHIATWNIAGQTPVKRIKKLIAKHDIDVLMLQEVKPQSIPALRKAEPCMSVSYVFANALLGGAKGNVIMVRGPVRDVHAADISAMSTKDLVFNGVLERRAALAVTADVTVDGKPVATQFITSHTDRHISVRKQQREALGKALDTWTARTPNSIYGGDLNVNPSITQGSQGFFAQHGMHAEATANTFAENPSTIDYIAYSLKGSAGIAATAVDTSFQTDHYLLTTRQTALRQK